MKNKILTKIQYINRIHRIFIEKTDIKRVFRFLEEKTFPNVGIKRAAIVQTEDNYKFYYKYRINKNILKDIREQNYRNLNDWINGNTAKILHYGSKYLFVFESGENREWVYFEPLHLKEDYFGILILTADEKDISQDDHFIFFLLANHIAEIFYLDDNLKKAASLNRLNRKFLKHSKTATAFLDKNLHIVQTNILFRKIFKIRKKSILDICKYINRPLLENMISSPDSRVSFEFGGKNFEGRIVRARMKDNIKYLLLIDDVTEVIALKKRIWQNQKLRELGEISLRIAHEIRNPLQVILGFIQLLNEQEDPEKQKEYSNIIMNESRHLNGLIEDLLLYAKKVDINFEECIPSVIVEEVCNSLKERADNSNITINSDLKRFTFVLDIKRFREIVTNILSNAIEKLEEEGRKNSSIDIYLEKKTGIFILNISDNGSPISGENIERIFNPFFTTKDNGHGLGLSIVKNLVEAMNGKIEVKSRNGKTSFIMKFEKNDLQK